MREIKFRAKRQDNGELIFGYYGYKDLTDEHFIIVPTFDSQGSGNRPQYFTDYLVDPQTVSQYTGIKDENGKEIYEGDILAVKFSDYSQNHQVRWGSWDDAEYLYDCECWMAAGIPLSDIRNRTYGHGDAEIEVVGNIYENPELI